MAVVQGVMRAMRREATASGLSMPQFMLIRWLHRAGPIAATRWADRIGASPSTVTALLDGLVEQGYVRRGRDSGDRRQVLVSLTPSGDRLLHRVELGRQKRLKEAFKGLSREEIERAVVALEPVARRFAPPEGSRARTRAGRTVGG